MTSTCPGTTQQGVACQNHVVVPGRPCGRCKGLPAAARLMAANPTLAAAAAATATATDPFSDPASRPTWPQPTADDLTFAAAAANTLVPGTECHDHQAHAVDAYCACSRSADEWEESYNGMAEVAASIRAHGRYPHPVGPVRDGVFPSDQSILHGFGERTRPSDFDDGVLF